jgi:hypothetical protein
MVFSAQQKSKDMCILAAMLGLLVMSPPGFEPGLPRPQRGVLTTIRWRLHQVREFTDIVQCVQVSSAGVLYPCSV